MLAYVISDTNLASLVSLAEPWPFGVNSYSLIIWLYSFPRPEPLEVSDGTFGVTDRLDNQLYCPSFEAHHPQLIFV